jgi:CPA2 family monovalent cation:H+ antiporter-2
MEFQANSLTGIALVMAIAMLFGIGLERLKQPAIVGYIVAGIVLGPTGFGVIGDASQVELMAELGIVLLLFIIGTELSLKSFISVFRVAVACTAIQLIVSLLVCYAIGSLGGWAGEKIVLFGFMLTLSSTAVAIKILDQLGHLKDPIGQITVGILIAQDLALVPMLVMADSFADGGGMTYKVWIKILIAVGLLVGLVFYLSQRDRIRLPLSKWFKGSGDLPPLMALALCFAAATISGALGLSTAYGAFLAGLIVSSSTERDSIVKAVHPIQSILLVVFFLSIGLMIDLGFIMKNLHTVLLFLLVAISIKTVLNIGALRLLGQSWENAFPAGLVMAQLGEFAFLLATIGSKGKILNEHDYRLAISVIALSLLLSPFWLMTVRRFHVLASHGVTNIKDIMRMIYEGELKTVSELYDHVSKTVKDKVKGFRKK